MDDKMILKLLQSKNIEDSYIGVEYLMVKSVKEIVAFFNEYGVGTMGSYMRAADKYLIIESRSRNLEFYKKGNLLLYRTASRIYPLQASEYPSKKDVINYD